MMKRKLATLVAALPLALTLGLAADPAHAGATLDAIKKRGQLTCGVNPGLAGFAATDKQGKWIGLDVDMCRALAAAVLGDPDKVKWVPLNAQQRFTALQSGEIDILSRNTTWTLTRDASLGLHFTGITYYDGQGFIVPRKFKVKSARELSGAEICIQSGTTAEKNLNDYFAAHKIKYKPVVFEAFEPSVKAFFAGRCQVYSTDVSALASIRSKEAANPDDYVILPELISKEPLGPMVRRGDDEWFAVAKWVLNALIEAEEYGVTQANVDKMKSSPNPSIQRMLGVSEDSGKLLGIRRDWAYQAIRAVGNYGEMFQRHLGEGSPLKLPRGANDLWTKGGLMYAPPIR